MNKIRKMIEAYEKHPTYVRISVTGYGIIYFENDIPSIHGTQITGWRSREVLETSIACDRMTLVYKLPDYAKPNVWYRNGKEIASYA